MRDYNAIPFKSPRQRHVSSSKSGPPSAVSKFVPNMSMDYVHQSNPRHSGERSVGVHFDRMQLPPQQRNAPETTSAPSDGKARDVSSPPPQPHSSVPTAFHKASSPESSPQSTEHTTTTYTESTNTPSQPSHPDASRQLHSVPLGDVPQDSPAYPPHSRSHDPVTTSPPSSSDASVMELRSHIRQLQRQLAARQEEHDALLQQLQQRSDTSSDARIGELQLQLDRAHARILTADMVRQELEDTLEAEQYTWDLRVQDQERMIQQMQEECVTLADELLQCKQQWQTAEQEWMGRVDDLQGKYDRAIQDAEHWRTMRMEENQDGANLKERLLELERERSELQNCLDEALKELEAVDAELQNDRSLDEFREENERLRTLVQEGDRPLLESLQQLYRWLLDRDGIEPTDDTAPRDAKEFVAAIHAHLERNPVMDRDLLETRKQVENLESQLSVYRGDLKAREESSNELRQSLKEAVALLKPLQEAVAKADADKAALQEQLEDIRAKQNDDTQEAITTLKSQLQEKEDECNRLQEETESLTIQLSKMKMTAAASLVSAQKPYDTESPSLSKAREGVRAKRQMLLDAQQRFSQLRSPNRESTDGSGEQMQRGANGQSEELEHVKHRYDLALDDLRQSENRIHNLENELKVLKGELAGRDVELRALEQALADVKSNHPEQDKDAHQKALAQIRELETAQQALLDEVTVRKASEKRLNKSLKEALSLLKPLQQHLEEAEAEKKELWEELMLLRRRSDGRSSFGQTQEVAHVRTLEHTVKQLESENARLHDALEDMSQTVSQSHLSGNTSFSKTESRLREDYVELKSRYEVTQGRLEDAHVENHALVESLKRREREERTMMDEIRALHEQLAQTQAALENAASALAAGETNGANPRSGVYNVNVFQRPRYQLGKQEDASPGPNMRRLI